MAVGRSMRILGIDPGTRVVGYGLVEVERKTASLVEAGEIAPAARVPLADRLRELHEVLSRKIVELAPDVVAIEKAFFGKNAASLIALGEGRGVVLLCAASLSVPIHEYAPAEVKKAVTGSGGARKAQVAAMVRSLLGAAGRGGRRDDSAAARMEKLGPDATDALAVALCHHHRSQAPVVASVRRGRSPVRRGRGR